MAAEQGPRRRRRAANLRLAGATPIRRVPAFGIPSGPKGRRSSALASFQQPGSAVQKALPSSVGIAPRGCGGRWRSRILALEIGDAP